MGSKPCGSFAYNVGGEPSRGVGDGLETWLRGSLGGNTQETGV